MLSGDDFGTNDPLRSHKASNKLHAFYFTILAIPLQ